MSIRIQSKETICSIVAAPPSHLHIKREVVYAHIGYAVKG